MYFPPILTHFLYFISFTSPTHAFSIPPAAQVNAFFNAAQAQRTQQRLDDSLGSWIKQESRIALDNLLANVAPGGRRVVGTEVVDGTVVASPSQNEPDYWYQCE